MSASTILKAIDTHPEVTIADLALRVQMDVADVAVTVQQLAQAGLLTLDGSASADPVVCRVMPLMPLEWLDSAAIARAVASADALLPRIEVCLETQSTNSDLVMRARDHSIHNCILLAEHQTAGRGRLGRQWVSPPVHNLYLSFGWQFQQSVAVLQGLSLAVGAAVAESLERCLGVSLSLKWPNDLYLNNAKVGGILIDVCGDVGAACTAVVGVGLNINMPKLGRDAIDQPWTSLADHSEGGVRRHDVAVAVIQALSQLLSGYATTGFAAWREVWQARDALRGLTVQIDDGQSISGIAAGVDEQGALLIETANGVQAVVSGEATLRKSLGECQ